ncbi:MAG: hypothetical protein AUJ32_02785 [Parcubacteria group bacterium CG1_02_40_82]|nr:MAG: hypothetical protein AUJ32_02785 [Parcubacteria group bacterium CG1_02_40_82]
MDKDTIQQNIIQGLGLQDLPEETQIKLLTQMTESVLKRVTVQVLERLSEQEREEFAKLQETGDVAKVDEFLKSKIPDYDGMVEQVVAEFKEEMKSNIETLKSA